jgi:uncharacterized cupin superfamily protein
MPKIDIEALPEHGGSIYPAEFRHVVRGRFRKRLGHAGGLTQFGVNLCRLEPGAASSLRHWHEREDELVYVLDGEVVLVEEEGETLLGPGDAASFRAGVANGHQLVNRGDRPALVLEIGTSAPADQAHYADVDMRVEKQGGRYLFTRRNGEPYPP